ncbi:MAG: hypothetical protein MJZ37_01095 [Bacilli bacterium]|nr:hypothetical protein [Bacilli bacterium]
MTLEIPELTEIQKSIEEIKICLVKPLLEKSWYTAEECWKLKGGGAWSTFRTNPKYQCKGGIPDGYVGGRKVWSRESVLDWLIVTDEKLPEYLEKVRNEKRLRKKASENLLSEKT